MKEIKTNLMRLLEVASLALITLLMSSCKNDSNVYDSMRRISSHEKPTYNNLKLEQIQLDSVRCSGESFSWVQEDQGICYLDRFYGWLYKFDANGHLLKRTLGYGRAANESTIKHCMIGTMSNDGELAIAGTSLDFEYFSKDLTAVNRFLIVVDQNKEYATSDFLNYTTPDDCIARFHKGKLYEGLLTDDPDFMFGPDYEKEVYHIGVVDMNAGKELKSEIKGLPSMFSADRSKYRALDFVSFDIDEKDNLFINFAADSLIYVFDHNRKPKYAFGRAGKNMDTDYERFGSLDEMDAYGTNLMQKGYYSWVEYIDETGICCRSYKKGAISEYDGIQMYKDGKLIADCNVPKGFKVVGYIAPYYYSQVIDNEDEHLKVYRFKLD